MERRSRAQGLSERAHLRTADERQLPHDLQPTAGERLQEVPAGLRETAMKPPKFLPALILILFVVGLPILAGLKACGVTP